MSMKNSNDTSGNRTRYLPAIYIYIYIIHMYKPIYNTLIIHSKLYGKHNWGTALESTNGI